MKTILSSGILGFLSVILFACGGEDSHADAPAGTIADNAADSADDVADAADTDAAPAPGEQAPGAATPVAVTPPNPEAPIDPTLEAAPVLSWRSCGTFQDRDLECAEVLVPIDYDQPEGAMLPIAMRRIVANPLEPYRGSLLINPGGPGGAGIDFALSGFRQGIFDAIAPGYDIVGFDPRGVGESGERGCGIQPEELYPTASAVPDEGLEGFVAGLAELGAECEREWGPLFRKLGSNNVVRDMEEIRKALRESKLNFYGGSYGTRLGSLYAHMFPATAGRIVLDASVHPRSSMAEAARDGFYYVAALHEQVFVDCETGVLTCPPDSRVLFEQMLTSAREGGFEDALSEYWRAALETEGGPEALASALSEEANDPGGAWLGALVNRDGGPDDGGAGMVALFSVNCTDDVSEPPTVAQVESLFAEFNAVNPLYADDALLALFCTGWPATRDPVPLPTAPSVDEPLLVIGGLRDWRTPYSGSVAMTETLGKATLLTSDHQGHGAVSIDNQCVNYFVRAYLTSGSLPATGTVCE
jgi:pimeloyl-ACP methyl ester carboxylesterase